MIKTDYMSEYDKTYSRMKYILKVIQDISDLDYQYQLWIEGSIPNFIGSWEDTMMDFDIDTFLENLTPESNPEFGLSQYQIDELWRLKHKVDHYCSLIPKYIFVNPRDVIADPRWHEVVACAQETLKAFEGYEVPRDDEIEA